MCWWVLFCNFLQFLDASVAVNSYLNRSFFLNFYIQRMVLSLRWLCICVSGDRHLDDRATDRREILHDGWSVIRTGLWCRCIVFRGFQMRDEKRKGSVLGPLKSHSTANISKTVSRSVTRQLGLNISSTEPFEIFIAVTNGGGSNLPRPHLVIFYFFPSA